MMGVDWDSDASIKGDARSVIAGYTPCYESPVWQSGQLQLPSNKLMTRKTYVIGTDKTDKFDTSPGTVVYYSSAPAGEVGSLWIDYDVTLSGTHTA